MPRFLLAFLIGFSFAAQAQNFTSRVYGGTNWDDPDIIRQTPDSGFYIGGTSVSYVTGPAGGASDAYLVRTDKTGDTLWTLSFGTTNADFIYDIQVLPDGGCAVSGLENLGMFPYYYMFLARITPAGQIAWSKVYGPSNHNTEGGYLLRLADGGFLLSGCASMGAASGYDAVLCRTDSSGNLLWGKTYGTGTTASEFFQRGRPTPDGGFIYVGRRNASGYDFLLTKIDSLGNIQWCRTYGTPAYDFGYDVECVPGGGYICFGRTGTTVIDMYAIRVNNAGDTLWTEAIGGTANSDWGYGIMPSYNHGFVIVGTVESFSPSPDAFLAEIDTMGVIQWSRTYGGAGWEEGWYAIPTLEHGFAISARDSSSGMGSVNFWLVKTDSTGNGLTCNETVPNTQRFPVNTTVGTPPLVAAAMNTYSPITFQSRRAGLVQPYCMTTAAAEQAGNDIRVYPVPAQDEFTIHSGTGLHNATATLFNVQGQAVIETKNGNGNNVQVSTSMLPEGIYFIRVTEENKLICSAKIVIAR